MTQLIENKQRREPNTHWLLRPKAIGLLVLIVILNMIAGCSNSGTAELTSDNTDSGKTNNTSLEAGVDTSSTENNINSESNSSSILVSNTDTGNSEQTTVEVNAVEVNVPLQNEPSPTPNAPPAQLVLSAKPPNTDTDNNVMWNFDPIPSDLEVIIQPYVELPLATNGLPARWNTMGSFDNRLFVADEHDGRVYEITNGEASLWFDIADAIQSHTGRSLNISNSFHGGLRGIAFHPDFTTNGKFYASLMEQRPNDTTNHFYISDNSGIDADSVLVEWTADITTLNINPASYREIFRVGVPEYDHPIKQIAFNPYVEPGSKDYGNLYIAHGDGSVESTLAGTGMANDALGKILRINPLQAGDNNYSVPTDNPFTQDNSLPNEVYSYGHRNPHHLAFSIDGHLLATEAGRDNVDEINLIKPGSDYGWPEREGAFVHLDAGTLFDGVDELPENDALNGHEYPVVQFGHHGSIGATFTGEALGGGFVVENGSALNGEFFYIDFPKTGLLMHSSLTDMLQAKTNGAPSELTNAQTFSAIIKFDHDANPDTPPLDNDLKQIVQSAAGYVNVFDRLDIRIHQGTQGELYLTSKRNNMVYVVSNSVL